MIRSNLVKAALAVAAAAITTAHYFGVFEDGNDDSYAPSSLISDPHSPLKNMKTLWLGSSFTGGLRSKGHGIAEYVTEQNGMHMTRMDAVSGSPLPSSAQNSGVRRLQHNFAGVTSADLFFLEISPEDAGTERGRISGSGNRFSMNTGTYCGALEYCILYARQMWNPRIILFTHPYSNDSGYESLIKDAQRIAEIYHVDLIDLYHDRTLLNPDPVRRKFWMNEGLLTMAGCRDWITPHFSEQLKKIIGGE
ncbi:MAG: hypothetical protein E7190_02395 [Erysipelotrichaceae bacterium]|nr:hypothetical protein [Erysipelotrichaceae bacterium]